jgi:hypothetical protein
MIDLLILLGWTSLALGGVLKAIAITTNYRPDILTLGPLELVQLAAICLLFALALAARTWVKANEPEIIAKQRRVSTLRAVARATAELEPTPLAYAEETPPESGLPTRDGTAS